MFRRCAGYCQRGICAFCRALCFWDRDEPERVDDYHIAGLYPSERIHRAFPSNPSQFFSIPCQGRKYLFFNRASYRFGMALSILGFEGAQVGQRL